MLVLSLLPILLASQCFTSQTTSNNTLNYWRQQIKLLQRRQNIFEYFSHQLGDNRSPKQQQKSKNVQQKPDVEQQQHFSLPSNHQTHQKQCRPLTIEACGGLGYNRTLTTRTAIWYGHIDITQAPQCSEHLLFFVCMMLQPICFSNYADHVRPCRSVCHKVKRDCHGPFSRLNIKWPEEFDCHRLPEHDSDICITPQSIVSTSRELNQVKSDPLKCKCTKRKAFQGLLHFNQADYVIEGTLISKIRTQHFYKLKFKIQRVFKFGSTKLNRFTLVNVYTKCWCNDISFDKRYIVMAHESHDSARLLLDSRSIVLPSRRKWRKVMRKYKHQLKESKRRSKTF